MFKSRSLKFFINFQTVSRRFCHGKEVRVRFAPSPTGNLHLGGLRTALYNFLFAKSRGGKFLLRIEDTDQSRIVQGAQEQLQKDLNWAGIYIDEGPGLGGPCGPYIQSQRLNLYREQVKTLLDNGSAYYCFCSNKRMDLLRLQAMRAQQIPKYDNRCRHLSKQEVMNKLNKSEPHCIRFKLTPGVETFDDIIYGAITYDVELNEGDPIIIKSDGYPTYHFANIVDDHFMEISHVLRGVEWQISTTKHLMMYRAFNWSPPRYGHLPLLLNSDGSKLSKRQNDIEISHYKQMGIFPQALINFIIQSGGGFEKDKERGIKPKSYSMDELAAQFNPENISTHSGKLMKDRLLEFNQLEIERHIENEADLKLLVTKVQNLIKETFSDRISVTSLNLNEEYIKTILVWAVNRIQNLNDLVSKQLAFLWVVPTSEKTGSLEQQVLIGRLREKLDLEDELNKESVKTLLQNFAKENDMEFKNLMQLLRAILSGLKEGPGVAEMMEILGKENTLLRLESYIKKNCS